LQCEDTRVVQDDDLDDPFVDTVANVVIRYDFNLRLAVVTDISSGIGQGTRKVFKSCREVDNDNPSGRLVFDPFTDECHVLWCKAGEELQEGQCIQRLVSDVRELKRDDYGDPKDHSEDEGSYRSHEQRTHTTNTINNDDHNRFYRHSSTPHNNIRIDSEKNTNDIVEKHATKELNADDEVSDCDPVQIDKQDYYMLEDDSGTIFVRSMKHGFKRGSYSFDESHSLIVCSSDWVPQPIAEIVRPTLGLQNWYNFTMLSYSSPYQRLAGILGLLLAVLCMLVSLATFWAFPAFRSSAYGKSFFCFMMSLLLVHLIFLAIQIVDKLSPEPLVCFCLSAAAQFSSLSYVFWLNVMSFIVFKSLLRKQSTVTFAPVAATSAVMPYASSGITGFLLFSLYAWVSPLIIVAISIALATFKYDGWYDPDKRVISCWTLGLSQLLLLIVPMCLVLVINFAMFAVVFVRICLRSRRRRLNSNGSTSLCTVSTFTDHEQQVRLQRRQLAAKEVKKQERRYTVCFQLTILTSLTWTFAALSVFTHWPIVSHLFIAFQAILGVTVCLAAVCNSQVWRTISARRHVTRHAAENGAVSHSGSGVAKYCTFETDGATIYLKDNGNKIIMRETSI